MNHRKGIAGLPDRVLTLEARIEAHLKRVPADAELKDSYVDPTDRQNVRHRALISAVLDASFEHCFADSDTNIIEVEVEQELDVWSELARARNAFNKDAHHLNNGNRAESCLSPASKESILPVNTIGADRELLIVWLATIEVWDKKRDGNRFAHRKAIYETAAKASDKTASSYKTNRSSMKRSIKGKGKRFSIAEQKMYQDLINSATSDEALSAFAILLPAALALSAQKTPTKLSADKLKG